MARAKKTETPKKVYGVLADKLDEASIDGALEQLKLAVDDGSSIEDKVARLVAYFRENTAQANLAKCDVCEGKSDATAFDLCPYCGTGDEDEEGGEPKEAGDEPDGADGDEPEEADGDEPKVDAPEEADNEQEEAPEPEPDPKPKATKGKATKGKATKGKATKGKATKGKATKGKAKKAELVTVDVDPRFSVNDLDNAVKRANDLTRAGAVVAYELGVQLRQIHEDQLWKLRKGEDGAPIYKSFEAFVMAELEISRQTAYEQIDVSANYQKDDVEKLGYKKLALLLKAPEQKRIELKEKAEKGASFRELQADVKTARAEAGVTKRNTGRKATPQGKARDGKSGKGDSITIAALLGKQSVKLFKDIKKSGSEELVPAESLDDKPWGMLELRNGVVEVFYLTKTAKGLVLQVKIERRKP